MGALQQAPGQPLMASGTVRNLAVPACNLTADDLRRLYQILERQAQQAAELQVRSLVQGQMSQQQFQALQVATRRMLHLTVRVQSPSGEWIASESDQPLRDEMLPAEIAVVEFQSAFMFRNQTKFEPGNSFTLTLDFGRTGVLDMTNVLLSLSQNRSGALISGNDTIWANGVYEELRVFFDQRHTTRFWLHSRYAYDALLLPIGFPLSLIVVNHFDRWLRARTSISEPVAVALYVYVVVLSLLFFRLLFNYAKWVWPKLEGPNRIHGILLLHKLLLTAVAAALIAIVVTVVVKFLGFPT